MTCPSWWTSGQSGAARAARCLPILEEIAGEHADKITIVKLNVDENPATAAEYGVVSIPTLNVYQGGRVVKTIVGAKPKALLLKDLEAFI